MAMKSISDRALPRHLHLRVLRNIPFAETFDIQEALPVAPAQKKLPNFKPMGRNAQPKSL
jgi:hypothetical protein